MVNEITALTTELQELSPNTDKYDHLKKEVEAIDQKIDQAVYKLYGLTNEEITTIEQ